MKIKKQVISIVDAELNVKEITLLSAEEYYTYRYLIPQCNEWWWLRSPGPRNYRVNIVTVDSDVRTRYTWAKSGGIRPLLKVENSDLKPGDKIILSNYTWTALTPKLVLCDKIVKTSVFRYDKESKNANDYNSSDVKTVLNTWAMREKII